MLPPEITNSKTLFDLLDEANIASRAETAGHNPAVRSIEVDSTRVREGSCFVALTGSRVDGHDFVGDAVARGAAAVVVQAGRSRGSCPIAIHVPDTHEAVARMAAAFYGLNRLQRAGELTLVGVTGTNGKSTVCALVNAILRSAGLKTALLGTIQNDLPGAVSVSSMTTLPPVELCATLARAVESGATHAVLEVSSHALDQRRCAGLSFAAGVFTNLTQDHLDYHESMDAYGRAKKRLFDSLPQSASAVVCADDPSVMLMTQDCRANVLRYGVDGEEVEIAASKYLATADGTRFDLDMQGEIVSIASPLLGRHNVANMLAAAGAARALGISASVIQQGLQSVANVRGRLERVAGTHGFKVFVDYAHTPDALQRVVSVVRDVTAGRVICVFGCGGDRDRSKRPDMARAASLADVAIVTSDNPRTEDPNAIIADAMAGLADASCEVHTEPDRSRAIRLAVGMARKGDAVLIAGKGHEDYQVIGTERRPFDDVAVATGALHAVAEVVS